MPLIQSKSKHALSKNIETEMNAGKPQKQSIAIAYNLQRKAKKMKDGGMAEPAPSPAPSIDDDEQPIKKRINFPESASLAHGGEVEDHYDSIADAILAKKHAKKMADGGMVDLNENSEESPNQYDEINMDAAGKELYDDSQLESDPMDSNEHGDKIDSDDHDMVDKIRAKIRSKRGL